MAKNLLDAATESAAHPDPHVAVIAWLGYVPPSANVEALESTAIPVAAANLAALQRELEHSFPAARVTWACHSFGTLVCASALVGADPDAVVLLGSPGVTYKHASDLPTDADVFAALGDGDPIRLVGALDAVGGGFGPNPAATQFGAVRLPTDPGAGHSDYYRPGSSQLTALAQVVLGEGRATRRSQETLHEEAGESWPIAGNERLNRQAVASKRPSGLPSY
jgi:hypothetical protein